MRGVKYIRNKYDNVFAKIHSHPLFILGNEKSGTTAIAALIANATGKTVTLDIKEIWNPKQLEIYKDTVKIREFIHQQKYAFKNDIIKEPVLTFEYDSLRKIFPDSKFILIVRDPRDNIRSILNRLKIPGTVDDIDSLDIDYKDKFWQSWITVLDNSWLLSDQNHERIIQSMAYRWNYIFNMYRENQREIFLIKYEEFKLNKEGYIKKVCKEMGYKIMNDFSKSLNVQYQRKGDNSLSWSQFFGHENLNTINQICAEGIKFFKYD